MTIKHLVEEIVPIARRHLMEEKYHPLTLIVDTERKGRVISAFAVPAEQKKEVFFRAGQELAPAIPIAAVLAMECWRVTAKTEIGVSPSKHPQRQEALAIVGVDRDGEKHMALFPFVKVGGEIFLGDEEPGYEGIKTSILEYFWMGVRNAEREKR